MRTHQTASPASRTVPDDDLFIETMLRGFTRCMEAEAHLDACVSDHDLEVAQQHISNVKLDLQQALDQYIEGQIQRWFGARPRTG